MKHTVAARIHAYGTTLRAPLGTGGGVARAIRSKG